MKEGGAGIGVEPFATVHSELALVKVVLLQEVGVLLQLGVTRLCGQKLSDGVYRLQSDDINCGKGPAGALVEIIQVRSTSSGLAMPLATSVWAEVRSGTSKALST